MREEARASASEEIAYSRAIALDRARRAAGTRTTSSGCACGRRAARRARARRCRPRPARARSARGRTGRQPRRPPAQATAPRAGRERRAPPRRGARPRAPRRKRSVASATSSPTSLGLDDAGADERGDALDRREQDEPDALRVAALEHALALALLDQLEHHREGALGGLGELARALPVLAGEHQLEQRRVLGREADVGRGDRAQPRLELLARRGRPRRAARRRGARTRPGKRVEQRLAVGEVPARRAVADADLARQLAQRERLRRRARAASAPPRRAAPCAGCRGGRGVRSSRAQRLAEDVDVDIFVVIDYIVAHDNFKLHLPPRHDRPHRDRHRRQQRHRPRRRPRARRRRRARRAGRPRPREGRAAPPRRCPARPRSAALDLASLASVREFAAGWDGGEIDLLINNAGVMVPPLTPHRRRASSCSSAPTTSATSRSPTCCSTQHHRAGSSPSPRPRTASGRIDFDDLNWERKPYRAWRAYGQSKLANLLFTAELQRRLDRGRLAGAGDRRPPRLRRDQPAVPQRQQTADSWSATSATACSPRARTAARCRRSMRPPPTSRQQLRRARAASWSSAARRSSSGAPAPRRTWTWRAGSGRSPRS